MPEAKPIPTLGVCKIQMRKELYGMMSLGLKSIHFVVVTVTENYVL